MINNFIKIPRHLCFTLQLKLHGVNITMNLQSEVCSWIKSLLCMREAKLPIMGNKLQILFCTRITLLIGKRKFLLHIITSSINKSLVGCGTASLGPSGSWHS